MFYQIKEKFGELVVYWNFPDKDYYTDANYDDLDELYPAIQSIVMKYKNISKNTCIVCGKAATHMTDWGYIAPLCDVCEVPRAI